MEEDVTLRNSLKQSEVTEDDVTFRNSLKQNEVMEDDVTLRYSLKQGDVTEDDVTLRNSLKQSEVMEEDITLRNSKAVRQRRLNMVRTPTAVVSEVFGFLNEEVPSEKDDDDDEELTMSDGEVDQLFSNLDIGMTGFEEANIEDCVNGRLLLNGCNGDKFLAEFKSKDSGFASLERQRCEPSSLYDSFLENDDDAEDAVESICSNDIITSISESLYDDVDVSSVPRTVSMEVKSTCVDDETENAIVSSAEKFGVDSGVSSEPCSDTTPRPDAHVSHNEDVADKYSTASKGPHITIIMVKRPVVDKDRVVNKAHQKSPVHLETDVKITASEESSDTPIENVMIEKDNTSAAVICDSVESSSLVAQNPEAGTVFDFVIEPGGSDHDLAFAQSSVMDSYCFGSNSVASGGLFDYEVQESRAATLGSDSVASGDLFDYEVQESRVATLGLDSVASGSLFDYEAHASGAPTFESSDVNRAHSTGSENLNIGAVVCSTSSDDEDEDVRDSDCIAGVGDQAYDTIDMESHVDGSNSETVQAKEVDLSHSSECVAESHVDGSNNETVQAKEVDLDHSSECVAEDSLSDARNTSQATTPISEKSPFNITKRHKLEKNPSAEMASDDSSDEDVGIYAESFRRSNWVRLSQQGKLDMKIPDSSSPQSTPSPLVLAAADNIGSSSTDNVDADEVFNDPLTQATAVAKMLHRRTDSMTTTASETEFKFQYVSRRKCLIQRADSQQEYHRLSSRVYDQDKQVIIQRTSDSEDLGLHLLNSHPAFITSIDPGLWGNSLAVRLEPSTTTTSRIRPVNYTHSGSLPCMAHPSPSSLSDRSSAAEKAGLIEGQILVSVNDQNVLTTDHTDIVQLIQSLKGNIKMSVANSDFQPVRDLQATIMSGFMYKLGNSAFKMWKKRYFILRQDNCLYYYKTDQEHDPLGALPLGGYTISRHTETSKDFCFKAEKYGGRTYYFIADNRELMTEWVGALTEAAARSKKRKESFLSVSSHNVGLPALHIVKPECAGFLGKLNPSKRTWRRRYCVLKDACVYYYKDKNSVSALGVAHLHGYTVDVENYQRRKSSFSLQPPEKKMRVFYLSADNETDKKRWVESLIHSIQRWVRVDKEAEC